MMLKADRQTVQALLAMKRDPYGQHIFKWFEESLAMQRKENDSLKGEELGWGQGKAQLMDDFLDKVDKAADIEKAYSARPVRNNNQMGHAP